MQVKFVDVDGVRTRYLCAGEGKARRLLLIHGHDLIADVWSCNVDAFGATHHVIAPDMKGCGFSGTIATHDNRAIIAQRVEHLFRLADTLGWKQFDICGSSYGALVASLMYFSQPKRVAKLVLNGSASAFNTDEQLVANLKASFAASEGNIGSRTREQWHQRLVKGVYDPASIPPGLDLILTTAYAQPWLYGSWERSLKNFIATAADREHRVLHRLEAMDVETLLIWGKNDPGAFLENAEAGVKRMPQARLEVFDQCAHMPMFEHVDRYNAVIGRFLAG